jgi:hypothetical protein
MSDILPRLAELSEDGLRKAREYILALEARVNELESARAPPAPPMAPLPASFPAPPQSSGYPAWLDVSLRSEYDEYLREQMYINASLQNPYSQNKEYLPQWMDKLRAMEARLRSESRNRTSD